MSFCCCACIPERNYGIVQRFGKFVKAIAPGLACLCWPIDQVIGQVSTKLQQWVIKTEVKTKDNVFVTLAISIQYLITVENVETAYYSMQDPRRQVASFVENTLRSIAPNLILDDLFAQKDKVSQHIKDDLAKKMESYGYHLIDTLITEIEPEHGVKDAMNKINTEMRLREAAQYQADTKKIIAIKEAEAQAESKRLQGEGTAKQRLAIIEGLRKGIGDMAHSTESSPKEAMQYVLMTQYFDALREIGTSSNKAVIFIPHMPGAVGDISSQMKSSMLEAMSAQEMMK